MSKFAKVPEKPNFPEEEEKVLKYWEEIDAFKKQLEITKDLPKYTFYDGPPFATGLPHYGHILAGTIKDAVTRYATMKGHHVERRFGWDCHGLPIEFEIDKKYNIKSSVEREAIGVKEYNRRCREIVMTYAKEWRYIVGRFGRWIDFDNDYKTMDTSFMESVWWTFKQIYDKGLVYRGSKIMPFSTGCNTVLSNFEAGLNYKDDTSDPAIIITFPLIEDPETSFLAWTTTPWTLPSNLALNVHPKLIYVKFHDEEKNRHFICGEKRLPDILKQLHIKKHKIIQKYTGQELEGKTYVPLFEYYAHMKEQGCFKVVIADYVTDADGTSIVHSAPGFGEDDYASCIKAGIIQPGKAPCPIDLDGKFQSNITEYAGLYIKDADPLIKDQLKAKGRLVASSTIIHSYPFCWRSNTPLIYRAFDSWFIKVTDIKEDLQKNNYKSKWVPAQIQEGRFHNWLADAKDWCFSRNRIWGNPIPIWASDDMEEIVCVGSIKELKELAGLQEEITDLHRESIDHITIPSKQGKGELKRIKEVFDCWFESGSMPFAQCHYPFSINDEEFSKRYPADFIAEGLDQTRGWFYTLNVIATAVKNMEPYKNLIVNGIVLSADGSKMSKSKKNFPDPLLIAKNFGADACRLYLCNSPVARAEDLRFNEDGVKDIVKHVFLPWFNAYRFLVQNIARWESHTSKQFVFNPNLKNILEQDESANITDRWIIAANQHLIKYVRQEMDNYRLYNVVKHMLEFLEQLTNWYLRLNRSRMKGEEGVEQQETSLNTLFDVLMNTTIMMTCITPFMTEYIYQNLRNGIDPNNKQYYAGSIHFLQIPQYSENLLNEDIEKIVSRMQNIILLGRKIRDNKKISLKTPLYKAVIVENDQKVIAGIKQVASYIKDELNCLDLEFETNEQEFVLYGSEPDNELCGKALKQVYGKLKGRLQKLTREEILEYLHNKSVTINETKIEEGWLNITKSFNQKYATHPDFGVESNLEGSVMLLTTIDDNLKKRGISREIINSIQMLRKSCGINIDDQVEIYYSFNEGHDSLIGQVIGEHLEVIKKAVKMPFLCDSLRQKHLVKIGDTEYKPNEQSNNSLKITICVPNVHFNFESLNTKYGVNNNEKVNFVNDIVSFVLSHERKAFRNKIESAGGKISFKLNDVQVELKHGEDFYFDANEHHTHNKK